MSNVNDLLDYRIAVEETEQQYGPTNNKRFVKISEREDRSDLSMSICKIFWEKTFLQTWNDIFIDKGFFELSLFPMLVKELKPQTIIELGL
jgi:cephalosporin hydroxylase